MMKRYLLLALALCCLLCGCAAEPAVTDSTEGYTFTDDLGRTVTVNAPQRVAALLGSYADVWMLAGGTLCASADDAWEDFHLPMAADAVNLGGTKKLSLESLLSAAPDFVLASTNTPQHLEWQSTLEQAGITVAYFDVNTFDDYLRMLRICTDITNAPARYEEYGTAVQQQIDDVLTRNANADAPTVLVMRASAASIRAKNSDGTILGAMLRDFGCVNIADSDKGLLENLNIESILLQDPDKLFFVETGDDVDGIRTNVEAMFRENPLWYELTAVKNGELYYMDKHLFNMKPNGKWGDAYEMLEPILFP